MVALVGSDFRVDDDLAAGGESLNIALHEHLRFFDIRRRRKGHNPEHARAHPFCNRLDCSALSRSIAAFKNNYDAHFRGLDPRVEVAKLDLQLA